MNRQAILLLCVWSVAAMAQPNPPMPAPGGIHQEGLKLCEIDCTCTAQPGEVDICNGYWTFIKQGPGGNIVRVVNPDPNACTTAVNKNVAALATHFGNSPEFSLPTKEMATKASTFAPPAQAALPYSRLLDAAAAVVLSDPLDAQIAAQTARVLALTEDARSYLTVAGSMSQWQSASTASKRLIARVEGAEKALSLAKPWPKLREFAPKVWKLRICAYSKPAEVAALASRILNEGDLAWNFAFLDDWILLQSAFDTSSGAPNTGTPSFESIVRPFFAEPAARVKERTEKSLFTLLELRSFRTAVTTASAAIDAYSQDLNDKAKARRNELEKAFDGELAAVTRIREAFISEQAGVANLKSAVETAVAEKAKVQASIDSTSSDISTSTASLLSKTAQRDQRRQARAAAQADLTAKRAGVDEAQAKLQAVALNCGGQSYQTCTDVSAKKDFDKRRYESNKAVAAARSAMGRAQAVLKQMEGELLADDKAILELRGNIASMRTRLKELQVARETLEKNLTELGEKLQAAEDRLLKLTGLASKLDGAVVALGKVRPS